MPVVAGGGLAGGGAAMQGGGMVAGGTAVGGGVAGGGAMAGGAVGGVAGGAGGAGGIAAGGGCAGCALQVESGPAVMSYVGCGGDYTTETTYKYVGFGAGEFSYASPKKVNFVLIGGGVAALVLVVVVVLLLLTGGDTTTTTMKTSGPINCNTMDNPEMWTLAKKAYCCSKVGKGCTTTAPTTALPFNCLTLDNPEMWTPAKKAYCCEKSGKGCAVPKLCTLWGDPHIISFDQMDTDKSKAYSFYGDGDFWLVKSSTVSIQGRFEGTKYTEGLAATNQIVVGGAFLKGHKIEVGTLDSGILTVDGQTVIAGFPGSYSGAGFTVRYNSQGEVPDVVPEGNEKRVVHMDLPLGVKVRVFQWSNYMDVEIEMSKQPGQDGVCGNFNGNQVDDTTQSIMARVGARVRPSENLLSGQALIEWTPQMEQMMQAECAAPTRAAGQAKCTQSLGAAGNAVNSCTFDYCFGMNVRARSHAKTYA